jgi:hypothetical protein
MNGGAVIELRSPDTEAILRDTHVSLAFSPHKVSRNTHDLRNDVHEDLCAAGTASPASSLLMLAATIGELD